MEKKSSCEMELHFDKISTTTHLVLMLTTLLREVFIKKVVQGLLVKMMVSKVIN